MHLSPLSTISSNQVPSISLQSLPARLRSVIERVFVPNYEVRPIPPLVLVRISHQSSHGNLLTESVIISGEYDFANFNVTSRVLSPFRGVSFNTATRRWRSRMKVNKKCIHFGYFDSDLEAALIYNKESSKIYGSNAVVDNEILISEVLNGVSHSAVVDIIEFQGYGAPVSALAQSDNPYTTKPRLNPECTCTWMNPFDNQNLK